VPPLDAHRRPLGSLRLSVTDRCNLRCRYCMPADHQHWLPRTEILRFHELRALVDVFVALGVARVRLTGGEPLLRRDLCTLVGMLAANPAVADLALTTNGVLLAQYARALRDAGLRRVTISLDTLRPERFLALTKTDALAEVRAGIDAACAAGLAPVKLDAVILRGVNDDELGELLELGWSLGVEVRFIEYMAIGSASRWSPEQVVVAAAMLAQIAQRYGEPTPEAGRGSSPAQRYRLPDGRCFGIVPANSAPFCSACNRSRLTADGIWYPCLYAARGVDLKAPLRAGRRPAELEGMMAEAWKRRDDRGAELRIASRARATELGLSPPQPDPHLEMHTRGG
jgi:cyclic pyranopterin phosphate synthase